MKVPYCAALAVLIPLVAVACAGNSRVIRPAEPVVAVASSSASGFTLGINTDRAWSEGRVTCFVKNFFDGDKGQYKVYGPRIGWKGRKEPIIDRGQNICVDFTVLRRAGAAPDGDGGSLQISSGKWINPETGEEEPNWMDFRNGYLEEGQIMWDGTGTKPNPCYRVLPGPRNNPRDWKVVLSCEGVRNYRG